jgi:hypothetical protein
LGFINFHLVLLSNFWIFHSVIYSYTLVYSSGAGGALLLPVWITDPSIPIGISHTISKRGTFLFAGLKVFIAGSSSLGILMALFNFFSQLLKISFQPFPEQEQRE